MKKGLGIGCLVIVVLVFFVGCTGVFLLSGTDEKGSSDTLNGETEGTEDATEEDTLLQVGDSATINDITMTVNSVGFTEDRNQFYENTADSILVVEVSYENNSGEDISVGGDFDVYADGEKMESYPIPNSLMDGLSDGRTITGLEGFTIVGTPESIELEFEPMWSLSGEKAIYNVKP